MSSALTLEKSSQASKDKHPFLKELIGQIRLADTFSKYRDWSDELLIEKIASYLENNAIDSQALNLDSLDRLLINAFYQAIGNNIRQRTGHATETHIHLRNKEFSSAVIFCGGVLVLNSLIYGYRNFKYVSLQELTKSADNYICEAVLKASYYLDF